IFGLKNCDSCRKAMKAFPTARLVDVRIEGAPEDVLDAALAQFGAGLVNTRSTTWRGLDDIARALPPKLLIEKHPTVMKRPLIAVDKTLFLSWNKNVMDEIELLL